MLRALFTAASGMQAQQSNIDTIANNIANVNTMGFKQGRAEFQDLLYQTIRPAGSASSTSTPIPLACSLDWAHGRLLPTESSPGDFGIPSFDLTIAGVSFRSRCRPVKQVHPRRDASRQCRRSSRYVFRDALEPAVNSTNYDSITIGKDGTMMLPLQASQSVGHQLANFANPAGLNALGGNLFKSTTASEMPYWRSRRKRHRTDLLGNVENSMSASWKRWST